MMTCRYTGAPATSIAVALSLVSYENELSDVVSRGLLVQHIGSAIGGTTTSNATSDAGVVVQFALQTQPNTWQVRVSRAKSWIDFIVGASLRCLAVRSFLFVPDS